MIDWSKTNAHFYIPERFNLKYKQENELGWRKKWEEGKTVFEREKRNENFIECHSSHNTCYFAKVGNLHIEYHFENKYATYILEIEGDKRCSCNDCKEDTPGSFVVKQNRYYKKKKSRSLLLPRIIRLATREAPLSYYFVTLPPIIQILVDWSPFLRDRILVLAQHFLTLVRSDGSKVELDYTAEFQDLKNDFNYHIIESMRILEGVDIATADFNYGIYAYKDYINNKYYDHWGYVEHNRPDVVRVDETDEFTAKDSLGSLLLKNGFSKRALSQVHIIRRVNHPAGNYIAYV
jgi:hypothetical protein